MTNNESLSLERRYDEGDLYTRDDFEHYYRDRWQEKWDQAEREQTTIDGEEDVTDVVAADSNENEEGEFVKVERRHDTDGELYTKEDFEAFYGGTKEWDQAPREHPEKVAEPVQPTEQKTKPSWGQQSVATTAPASETKEAALSSGWGISAKSSVQPKGFVGFGVASPTSEKKETLPVFPAAPKPEQPKIAVGLSSDANRSFAQGISFASKTSNASTLVVTAVNNNDNNNNNKEGSVNIDCSKSQTCIAPFSQISTSFSFSKPQPLPDFGTVIQTPSIETPQPKAADEDGPAAIPTEVEEANESNSWKCTSCGSVKTMSGDHLKKKKEVKSQCNSKKCCFKKKTFVKATKAEVPTGPKQPPKAAEKEEVKCVIPPAKEAETSFNGFKVQSVGAFGDGAEKISFADILKKSETTLHSSIPSTGLGFAAASATANPFAPRLPKDWKNTPRPQKYLTPEMCGVKMQDAKKVEKPSDPLAFDIDRPGQWECANCNASKIFEKNSHLVGRKSVRSTCFECGKSGPINWVYDEKKTKIESVKGPFVFDSGSGSGGFTFDMGGDSTSSTGGGFFDQKPTTTTSGGFFDQKPNTDEVTPSTTTGGFFDQKPTTTTTGGFFDQKPNTDVVTPSTTTGGFFDQKPTTTTTGGFFDQKPTTTTTGGFFDQKPTTTSTAGFFDQKPDTSKTTSTAAPAAKSEEKSAEWKPPSVGGIVCKEGVTGSWVCSTCKNDKEMKNPSRLVGKKSITSECKSCLKSRNFLWTPSESAAVPTSNPFATQRDAQATGGFFDQKPTTTTTGGFFDQKPTTTTTGGFFDQKPTTTSTGGFFDQKPDTSKTTNTAAPAAKSEEKSAEWKPPSVGGIVCKEGVTGSWVCSTCKNDKEMKNPSRLVGKKSITSECKSCLKSRNFLWTPSESAANPFTQATIPHNDNQFFSAFNSQPKTAVDPLKKETQSAYPFTQATIPHNDNQFFSAFNSQPKTAVDPLKKETQSANSFTQAFIPHSDKPFGVSNPFAKKDNDTKDVTATPFGSGSVTANPFGSGVTATPFGSGSVTATPFGSGNPFAKKDDDKKDVTATPFGSGVTATPFGSGSVTATPFGSGSVTANPVGSSVTATPFGSGSVTANPFGSGSVTANPVGGSGVTAAPFGSGNPFAKKDDDKKDVTATPFGSGSVAANPVGSSVTATPFGSGSVTANPVGSSVTATPFGSGSVTANPVGSSVTATPFGSGSVTANPVGSSVTATPFGSGSVMANAVGSGVTATPFGSGSVTANPVGSSVTATPFGSGNPFAKKDDDKKDVTAIPFGSGSVIANPFESGNPFAKKDDDKKDVTATPFGSGSVIANPFESGNPFAKKDDDKKDVAATPFGSGSVTANPVGGSGVTATPFGSGNPFAKKDDDKKDVTAIPFGSGSVIANPFESGNPFAKKDDDKKDVTASPYRSSSVAANTFGGGENFGGFNSQPRTTVDMLKKDTQSANPFAKQDVSNPNTPTTTSVKEIETQPKLTTVVTTSKKLEAIPAITTTVTPTITTTTSPSDDESSLVTTTTEATTTTISTSPTATQITSTTSTPVVSTISTAAETKTTIEVTTMTLALGTMTTTKVTTIVSIPTPLPPAPTLPQVVSYSNAFIKENNFSFAEK